MTGSSMYRLRLGLRHSVMFLFKVLISHSRLEQSSTLPKSLSKKLYGAAERTTFNPPFTASGKMLATCRKKCQLSLKRPLKRML